MASGGKGSSPPVGLWVDNSGGGITPTVLAGLLRPYLSPFSSDSILKLVSDYVLSPLQGITFEVTTWIGGEPGVVDGSATTARLNFPHGLCFDQHNNIVVPDLFRVRKITPSGHTTTILGDGKSGFRAGRGLNCALRSPRGVTILANGTGFIVEELLHAVRKITPQTELKEYAGSIYEEEGMEDGLLLDAKFSSPFGLTHDPVTSTLYISTKHAIRSISADGMYQL